MLYKILLISLLLCTATIKAEKFEYPLVFELYKMAYITQINKEAMQIITKESLSGKQKIYSYLEDRNNNFFDNNLKNIKLNKQYQIKIIYEPDYDELGNPLQNAKEKYDNDEQGRLIAVCKGQCNI